MYMKMMGLKLFQVRRHLFLKMLFLSECDVT